MLSLYDLAGVYVDLLGRLEESPEEAPELMAQIEAVNADVCDKAEAYARIIQNKQRELDAYDTELERLKLRRTLAAKLIDRLKGNLLAAMELSGAPKIHTSIGTWSVRTNPAGVQIVDEKQIPGEYLTPQPAKVDKRAIMAAYREHGEIIPGAQIVRGKRVDFD